MDEKNNTNLEDVIERLESIEKKQSGTIKILSVICVCLALCLTLSLVYTGVMTSSLKRGFTESNGSGIAAEPNGSNSGSGDGENVQKSPSASLGIASGKVMGDYRAAESYEKVYDYLRKETEPNRTGSSASGFNLAMKEEVAVESAADSDMAASSAASGAGVSEFSGTNVMTEGVDESDISKTDGKYIYNATSSEIIIFDLTGGEAKLLTRFSPKFISPSDIIRELYLDGDTMSVITEHEILARDKSASQTNVLVYNISDRKNPEYINTYSQSGSYQTSRKTGDIIYLFTNMYLSDPGDNKNDALSESGLGDWIPVINDKLISADCIYLPGMGLNSLVISSFKQSAPTETIDSKMVVNNWMEIYVGTDSIYMYNQIYSSNREILKITKMSYDEGVMETGGDTSLRGHINDRFAINESDGYLRVVTTEWDDMIVNSLHVFDDGLKEVGSINNIAPGEQLYACRFMGDTGYFVTFEQTDPLFTVDLSDPANPAIIGELKIPGFSEYLHFWGEGKLLGIGYETDTNGSRKGLKLSMFNIEDPANVYEEAKIVIPKAEYSPAFYDYKAVLASPSANLIGFATERWDGRSLADYRIYSYDDGKLIQKDAENIDVSSTNRVRGHFSGDYVYISQDTKVSTVKM